MRSPFQKRLHKGKVIKQKNIHAHTRSWIMNDIIIFKSVSLMQNNKDIQNDFQLELRELQKTHSDSKTDSKVRLKVRNAGPY